MDIQWKKKLKKKKVLQFLITQMTQMHYLAYFEKNGTSDSKVNYLVDKWKLQLD